MLRAATEYDRMRLSVADRGRLDRETYVVQFEVLSKDITLSYIVFESLFSPWTSISIV